LEFVERPGNEEEKIEIWEARHNNYFQIPKAVKEYYAHRYTDNLKTALTTKKIIPFDPK